MGDAYLVITPNCKQTHSLALELGKFEVRDRGIQAEHMIVCILNSNA